MISKADMYWLDNTILAALDTDGEFQPIAQDFQPHYENVSRFVEWRLRNGTKPELGDGTLIANAIQVGDKLKLQICLTSGRTTVIPENDGFLFVLSGDLVPSTFAIDYGLGGIGQVAMDSRDDGVMSGKYIGHAELVSKELDGVKLPCVAVYCLDNSPIGHTSPISAIWPFNWRDAEEGQNKIKIVIEYEI